MSRIVVFVDTTHPFLPDILESNGFVCTHFYGNSFDDLKPILANAFGVIIRSKMAINQAFLDAAKSLKFIGRVGAGMENIDVDLAIAKGIKLFNAPEGNRDAVAEHSLGMLLALNQRILLADAEVRAGLWQREENRGVEVMGKTVAIIGYGNMGAAFAKRLVGFGARVIAFDKYKTGFSDSFVQEVDMDTVFQSADIVSLHIPQTEETKYLVNDDWIQRFAKSFTLINTSRGKIVRTSSLISALTNGKILGACLDVLEYESASFENKFIKGESNDLDYLLKSQKVILTPHIAGWTHESNLKLAQVLADKILSDFMQ